jgi:hypothetical protein
LQVLPEGFICPEAEILIKNKERKKMFFMNILWVAQLEAVPPILKELIEKNIQKKLHS